MNMAPIAPNTSSSTANSISKIALLESQEKMADQIISKQNIHNDYESNLNQRVGLHDQNIEKTQIGRDAKKGNYSDSNKNKEKQEKKDVPVIDNHSAGGHIDIVI